MAYAYVAYLVNMYHLTAFSEYPGQQWTEGREAMRYFTIVFFNGLLTEDG